jgi:hypothetical protein
MKNARCRIADFEIEGFQDFFCCVVLKNFKLLKKQNLIADVVLVDAYFEIS